MLLKQETKNVINEISIIGSGILSECEHSAYFKICFKMLYLAHTIKNIFNNEDFTVI